MRKLGRRSRLLLAAAGVPLPTEALPYADAHAVAELRLPPSALRDLAKIARSATSLDVVQSVAIVLLKAADEEANILGDIIDRYNTRWTTRLIEDVSLKFRGERLPELFEAALDVLRLLPEPLARSALQVAISSSVARQQLPVSKRGLGGRLPDDRDGGFGHRGGGPFRKDK